MEILNRNDNQIVKVNLVTGTQDSSTFPPTYFWYGKNDVTLKTLGYPFQGPAVRKALEANGVPCEVHVYENAPHAIGTGNGTDAEGWMTDAVAFWEQHTS